jgi:hypothetical protein
MPPNTQPKLPDGATRGKDFPSSLLARVIKANPVIAVEGPSPEGDIRFSTSLRALGLPRATLAKNGFCRTTFFVNLLGDLLVHRNLAQFAALLAEVETKNYDRVVNNHHHRHFGMQVDQNDVICFTLHISLIQTILSEDLEGVFDL